jgi:MoaA/NifB/PqqE/SkfB family radical SAM enzyme
MWISLTGGEPSIAQDFEQILGLCLGKVPVVNVITNGQRPDIIIPAAKNALRSSTKNVLIIHVTLFGEAPTHDAMTGVPGSYVRAIQTAEGLKGIGYEDRLIIGFEHMIGTVNKKEYKFVQYKANRLKLGITYTLEQPAGFYNNLEMPIGKIDLPRINLTLNPLDQFKNAFLLNAVRRAGCVAGEYSCFVGNDGCVYPCFFSIPDRKSFRLTDRDYKLLPEYFDGDRQWIDQCKGCWTPCESYTMLLFRPWRVMKR